MGENVQYNRNVCIVIIFFFPSKPSVRHVKNKRIHFCFFPLILKEVAYSKV